MNIIHDLRTLPKRYALKSRLKKGKVNYDAHWIHLQNCESNLIQLMNGEPLPPSKKESPELGWALHYLNEKCPFLRDFGLPATNISSQQWSSWKEIWDGKGLLLGDGTLVSTIKYATMDLGWTLALFNYMLSKIDIEPKLPFNHTPATIAIPPKPSLKIALLGDWGTGNYKDGSLRKSPSQLVMDQISRLKPDIMIHLGDVYYAGSTCEEQSKLLKCWKPAPLGNFTLNSNHEMYDGGKGIFKKTLASKLFQVQQNTTYFSISFGDWVILGLDSAYNATNMYLNGAINDPHQSGPHGFINSQSQGKKVILLTHHNPMDIQGETLNSLWDDVVNQSLNGRNPEVWYWGHIHNGVVYNNKAATGGTMARCLGHSAIPFGNSEWLVNDPKVDYYAHTPLGDPQPQNALRVKNGFAILEISDGLLKETWYDHDGLLAWQSQISPYS